MYAIRSYYAVDGRVYGVCIDKNAYCMFYNKEVFAKYGLSVPKTTSELTRVCEVLAQNGITPIAAPMAELWCLRYYDMVLTDVQCCLNNENWFVEKMTQEVPFRNNFV